MLSERSDKRKMENSERTKGNLVSQDRCRNDRTRDLENTQKTMPPTHTPL